MVTKTNEGIDKVYYCDPSLAKDGNPFQMPALLNINRDISQLQNIGGAGEEGVLGCLNNSLKINAYSLKINL